MTSASVTVSNQAQTKTLGVTMPWNSIHTISSLFYAPEDEGILMKHSIAINISYVISHTNDHCFVPKIGEYQACFALDQY